MSPDYCLMIVEARGRLHDLVCLPSGEAGHIARQWANEAYNMLSPPIDSHGDACFACHLVDTLETLGEVRQKMAQMESYIELMQEKIIASKGHIIIGEISLAVEFLDAALEFRKQPM